MENTTKLRKKTKPETTIEAVQEGLVIKKMSKAQGEIELLNNTFASSEWIEVGEEVAGLLSSSTDQDYYNINFGNHYVGLVTVEPIGNYAMRIDMFDEFQSPLGYCSGLPGQAISVRTPLKRNRTFYIKVYLLQNISAGEVAEYSMTCKRINNMIQETSGSNEDFYDAQTIRVSETVLGWIDNDGDWDTYRITPQSSGTMRLIVQPSDTDMRSRVYVYDDYEDLIDSITGLSGRPAELDIQVRAGRTYYIEVESRKYVSGQQYVMFTQMLGTGAGSPSWPYLNFESYKRTASGETFRIIQTKAVNIRSEIINTNIKDCNFFGINGGFFHSDNGYASAPTGGASIHWNRNGIDNFDQNLRGGTGNTSPRNAGTLFTYTEGSITKAGITQAANVADIRAKFGNINLQTVIGGGSLHLQLSQADWYDLVYGSSGEFEGGSAETTPLYDVRRTGIGYKVINGEWHIYMAVSSELSGASVYDLRNLFIDLGCADAIFLDGSGSSQFRTLDADGTILVQKGKNPGIETDRCIWNMIRLINAN